jgi:phage baseplate assembly protein gpV
VAGAETAMTAEALPHDGQRVHRILRGIVTTSAEAIGVSPRELVAAYRDGQSIAEQAAAHDVDVQVVKDALIAKGTAAIDAALERGAIDADQAAGLLERLPTAVDRVVDHHRGDRADAA